MVLVNNNNKSPGGHRSRLWLLGVGWLWLGRPMPAQRGLVSVLGQATTGEQHTFSGHARHRPAGAGAATARAIRSRGAASSSAARAGSTPLHPLIARGAEPMRCAPLAATAFLSPDATPGFCLATCWAERKRRERRDPPATTSSLPFAFGVAGPLLLFAPHHSK